nr:putative ribonuclease H-like domain-containing protein [Tanacetum cinerariifolium]
MLYSQVNDKYKTSVGYHAVPPPYIGNFMPPKPDLILADVDKYVISESVTSVPAVATNEAKTRDPKGGKITCKGKISTGKLDFEDVYFVKELKFNLFSVSQMCDKKNIVLFAYIECVVLSPDFKLLDESQVLLRVPKKNNMYRVDLKNVAPSGCLSCLFAKAALDESNLWHRRLGHINFKTMNKLVKGNLVRGLPLKNFENDHTCVACQKGKQHKASCKFDGKADEGFFVRYSMNRKAFRVFNSRTRIVEDPLHVAFLENKPNVAGSGPTWIFYIDTLTKSMNYKPVVRGNQSNGSAGEGKEKDAKDPGNEDNKDNAVDKNIVYGCVNDPNMPNLEEIVYSDNDEDIGAEADMTNLETNILVSPILTTKIHKDHPVKQIIRDIHSTPQTRRMTKSVTDHDLPNGKRAIGTKWIYINKKYERGIVVRNKARLVAQGYTQEEGIDYDHFFALVARIEAIRLFLAYALFKDFVVYQMDIKSAFLYGKIEEEVYVCPPLGFEDPEFPDRAYKVEKALYGLHQALKAWYVTLSTYLLDNGFQRGQIDKTLFIKRVKGDNLLVQVYVDDIIFGSARKEMCTDFEKMMHKEFQMSFIGELTFFLGLQVTQKDDGIFISQDKYVDEILKKFVKIASTPIKTLKPLMTDGNAKDVNVHLYRSMIGSLMYLTSLRPDTMFVVCACARFQVTPKVLYLHTMKRIFRYLKGQPKLGFWYPKDSLFNLEAYTESDYAGASLDRKSTTGACQFLGSRLISCGLYTNDDWNEVKQLLRMELRLTLSKVNAPRNKLTTAVDVNVVEDVHNLVAFLSKPTESEGFEQIIDFFNANPIKYALTVNLTIYTSCIEQFWATVTAKNINGEAQIHAKTSVPIKTVAYNVINEEMYDSLKRATTTTTSLDVEQDRDNISKTQSKATPNEPSSLETSSGGGPRRQDTLGDTIAQTREDRLKLNELMELCTKLSKRVLNLETIKSAQAKEISILKKRVKRLERKKKSRTYGLKRLYKVGLSARVESSTKEQSLGKEDASKQGRNIADIDADAEITLADETAEDQGRYDDQEMFDTSVLDDEEEVLLKEAQDVQNVVKKVIEDITNARIEETFSNVAPITTADVTPDELTMAQALMEIKKSKSKGATTTTTVTIPTPDSSRPKARGVVMQEPNQLVKDENLAWDNVQAMMDADYELATRQLKNKSFNEVQKAFDKTMSWINSFVPMDSEVVKDKAVLTQESSSKRAGDKLDQGRSKKQKVKDDKEFEELKRCLEIIPDNEDDVTIDAIPLSIKTLIIDYKIYKEGKKNYF